MLDETTLLRNIETFFGAGSNTFIGSLVWLIIYMLKYPDHQKRMREEINNAIGRREADYQDASHMPFTQAFIYEVLQLRTVIPVNLIQRATEDVRIGEYFIPADAYVVINFWAVDHDPELWPDPHAFKPERFLSEDGSKVVVPSHFTRWGLGKRNCIGEGMAKKALFQYVVNFVQNFHLKPPPGEEICTDAYLCLLLQPKKMPSTIFEPIT